MAWLPGWWEQLTGATCPGCAEPLREPILCAGCRALLVPRHLPHFVYLGEYKRFGKLAKAIKYHGQRELAAFLGQQIALGVRQAGWNLDAVTAIPTLLYRTIKRGYNQAELLAQAVARELHLPYYGVLSRTGWDSSQTEKTLLQRMQLSESTFRPVEQVSGKWLLVDDVVTTGTTYERARKAMLEAGAARVYGAAIAVRSPHQLSKSL